MVNVDRVNRGIATAEQIDGLELAPHLARLLVEGRPVPVERLASVASWPVTEAEVVLRKHPGIDWDEQGRLEGFGLSLRPTPHSFSFDGGTLYGACVSDALVGAILLRRSGTVESTCPVTGRSITIEVTPEGVQSVNPPDAVISMVRPAHKVDDVRAEICSLGNAFSSREAAAPWLDQYPEGFIDSVAEEFQVQQVIAERMGWTPA